MILRVIFGVLWYCALAVTVSACGSSGASPVGGDDDDGGINVGGGTGGGGGGDPPPVSPFNLASDAQRAFFEGAFHNDFLNVRATYDTGGDTLFINLPSLGLSAYEGYMEISFFSTPGANIQSDATLTVDMQTGAASGGASGFMGSVFDDTTSSEQLVVYEGDLVFSGGSLTSGPGGTATLSIDIDGAFDNGVQVLLIDGVIDGSLYGPSAEGVYLSGAKFPGVNDITTIVDGTEVFGTAALWALKQTP